MGRWRRFDLLRFCGGPFEGALDGGLEEDRWRLAGRDRDRDLDWDRGRELERDELARELERVDTVVVVRARGLGRRVGEGDESREDGILAGLQRWWVCCVSGLG